MGTQVGVGVGVAPVGGPPGCCGGCCDGCCNGVYRPAAVVRGCFLLYFTLGESPCADPLSSAV